MATKPGWTGNLHLWFLYLVLAWVIYSLGRRYDDVAKHSALLVPLVDMPMLFWIQVTLVAHGHPGEAIAGFTAGGYVMFIIWSAFGLDARLTMFASTVAGALEACLFLYVDGDEATVAVSMLLMTSAGGLMVFYAGRLWETTKELAESKVRREQAELATAEKDRFVSTVSHDFRAPLSVVLTSLQTMAAVPDLSDSQRRDFLERAVRQCRRLRTMTDALLQLARLGVVAPQRQTLDARALVQSAVEAMQPRAAQEDIELALVERGRNAPLHGDYGLLERALLNLIDNALKFTPGGGRVEVGVIFEGDRLRLEVVDDGPGIPEDEQMHVFEPFYRSSAQQENGFGLGLALVREIAHLHRGRVVLESTLGHGSRFALSVPADGGSR